MLPASFRVWDDGDTDENGVNLTAADGLHGIADSEEAAEVFAERKWPDDYPDEQTVCVRAPDGAVTTWTVRAERTVTFRATKKGS